MKLEREIKFCPYGKTAYKVFFILKGKKGAVTFLFSMSNKNCGEESPPDQMKGLFGMGVDYHSAVPVDSWQKENKEDAIVKESCEFLDGKPCYMDGSSLLADEYLRVMKKSGSDRVWELLEDFYKNEF